MKDKDIWGILFAGISAAAGITYLYVSRNKQVAAPVTNVFPPLNTGDPAPTENTEPMPDTQSNANTTTQPSTPKQQVYPVYLV